MTQMTKGANIAITPATVRVTLYWSGGPGVPDVDASALLVQPDGRVGSEADFVFYNQPQDASGAVRHSGKNATGQAYDVIDVNLAMVPARIDRVVFAASADDGMFGQVPNLMLVVADLASGTQLAVFPMQATVETAFVSGELYRRADGWKFRAVGQGYSSGLAGLAADFGIDTGGSADAAPAPAPAPAPAAPAPAPAAPPNPFTAMPPPAPAAAPQAPAPAAPPAPAWPAAEPAPVAVPVAEAPAAPPADLIPAAPAWPSADPAAAAPAAPAWPSADPAAAAPAAPAWPSADPAAAAPAAPAWPSADPAAAAPAAPIWPATAEAVPPAPQAPAPPTAPEPPSAPPAPPVAPAWPGENAAPAAPVGSAPLDLTPPAPAAPDPAAPAGYQPGAPYPPQTPTTPAGFATPDAYGQPGPAAPTAPAAAAPMPAAAMPAAPLPAAPVYPGDPSEDAYVPPAQPVAATIMAPPPGAPPLKKLDMINMTIERHDRVDLVSSGGTPLTRLVFGVGWQPAPGRGSIDFDASVIAFDSDGNKLAIVWNQHPTEFYGALQHTGDSKSGSVQAGQDAERILVELTRLPDHVGALVFATNSFSGQTFTDVVDAYCAVTDENGTPILRYDLSDTQPSTAVIMAIVRRSGPGTWSIRAIGEFHDCRSVRHLIDPAARQVGIY